MADPTQYSTHTSSSSSSPKNSKPRWPFTFLVFILPAFLAVLVYQLDSFDPAPYPVHELTHSQPMIVPKVNDQMLKGAEKVGNGKLLGPEDIAYDYKSGVIYTGCGDGWIKRVKLNESAAVDSVVEKWVNTDGRPLGLVHGHHGDVIIADAFKEEEFNLHVLRDFRWTGNIWRNLLPRPITMSSFLSLLLVN